MFKIRDFNNKLKQYGYFGMIIYLSCYLLRTIGIKLEFYYFLINKIDFENQLILWRKNEIKNVQQLNLDDFLKASENTFTQSKLNMFKDRIKNGYIPYGIIEKNVLIYSCWISLKYFEVSNNIRFLLNENECLKIDAYCNPNYRGKGIHTAMNSFRLIKSFEYGKNVAIAVVYWLNKPALKSQKRVGYNIKFKFFVLTFFGKSYTNYYKKKLQCK